MDRHVTRSNLTSPPSHHLTLSRSIKFVHLSTDTTRGGSRKRAQLVPMRAALGRQVQQDTHTAPRESTSTYGQNATFRDDKISRTISQCDMIYFPRGIISQCNVWIVRERNSPRSVDVETRTNANRDLLKI